MVTYTHQYAALAADNKTPANPSRAVKQAISTSADADHRVLGSSPANPVDIGAARAYDLRHATLAAPDRHATAFEGQVPFDFLASRDT
jgi:hypothetical protein